MAPGRKRYDASCVSAHRYRPEHGTDSLKRDRFPGVYRREA